MCLGLAMTGKREESDHEWTRTLAARAAPARRISPLIPLRRGTKRKIQSGQFEMKKCVWIWALRPQEKGTDTSSLVPRFACISPLFCSVPIFARADFRAISPDGKSGSRALDALSTGARCVVLCTFCRYLQSALYNFEKRKRSGPMEGL